ncbi:MAG TPA: hypothetical protein VFQ50_09770 [Flavobacterium sp.]|nr:hypothetical protein [Flavobacterium sp.]
MNVLLRPLLISIFFFPMLLSAQLSYTVDHMLLKLNDIDLASGDVSASRVNFDNRFAEITNIASDDELTHIALTEKPILRDYAVAALIERQSPELLRIFTDYTMHDEPFVKRDGNRTYQTSSAAEFYKNIAKQKERLVRKAYYERTASKEQIAELRVLFGADFDTNWTMAQTDSLLQAFTSVAMANDAMSAGTMSTIFRSNEYKSDNYERVKFFAEKFQTPEILATLASFKRPEDVPFLLNNFENSLIAITRFPHAAFLPKLQMELLNHYQDAAFQTAVAGYQNADAAKMLSQMVDKLAKENPKKPDEDRAEKLLQLYNIIESVNSPLYDVLLKRMQKF